MKSKAWAYFLFTLFALASPVFAQEILQEPVIVEADESLPVKDFNNIIDQQLLDQNQTIINNQTTLDIEEEFEIESEFIDPDFLKDEGSGYDDYAKVKLRFLNKITAENETFELSIGKTVAYGSLRIRPMACKKAPPIDEPESASFLQIWEKIPDSEDEWNFSGWMFASSPSLSALEHPVYDVWVMDCFD